METKNSKRKKYIIDLEKLNTLNAEGCPACSQKFELGDTVVIACGAWEGGPKYIHEREAVFDERTSSYMERRCYESSKDR
jgi:hypothetical protein